MPQKIFDYGNAVTKKHCSFLFFTLLLLMIPADEVFSARRCEVTVSHPYNGCERSSDHEFGGTRLVNDPCGYVLGWAIRNQTFDKHETSGAGWHYGRAWGSVNMCSWAYQESLTSCDETVADSCSETTKDCLKDRNKFGKEFNCPEHQCTDGSPRAVISNCPFYLNYFYGSCPNGFESGSFKDPFGVVPGTEVKYRYTTLDGQAAMVHVSALDGSSYNWGFIPTSCFNITQPTGTVWVDFGYGGPEQGTEPQPYNTLGEGVNAVTPGGEVIMKPGTSGERPTLSKPMYLKSSGGTATVGR